jgi:tRNA(Ser,Leu) C12 N-acetylase TAN1
MSVGTYSMKIRVGKLLKIIFSVIQREIDGETEIKKIESNVIEFFQRLFSTLAPNKFGVIF